MTNYIEGVVIGFFISFVFFSGVIVGVLLWQ